MIKIIRKLKKKLKFIQKLLELKSFKKLITNLLTRSNYAAAYYQSLEEVPGPLVQEKIQKHEKIANNLKIA